MTQKTLKTSIVELCSKPPKKYIPQTKQMFTVLTKVGLRHIRPKRLLP